jgi:hypothetical protein
MLCLYPVSVAIDLFHFSQSLLLGFISWIPGNFIYFEICRARMVTIRHSFDPEEFRAHESF